MVHRTRVPSIAKQIKLQADLTRLNLKTREELVSKTALSKPISTKERFDVSVDLSHHCGNSGFSIVQTSDNKLPKVRNNKIDSKFLQQAEIMRMKPDGFRRISIQTDTEFGGPTKDGLHPLSPTKDFQHHGTIVEDEHCFEEDGSPSALSGESGSLLPKRRRVQKQRKIQDSVLHSRHESSRLNDALRSQNTMTPSIRKALKDRANFYRRKLKFYENLDVLAQSMTSQELKAKIAENVQPELNSS